MIRHKNPLKIFAGNFLVKNINFFLKKCSSSFTGTANNFPKIYEELCGEVKDNTF